MFENPRRGRQARNFTTNVPKILDLRSSSEQIFSRKLSLGAPEETVHWRPKHWILNFPLTCCRHIVYKRRADVVYRSFKTDHTSSSYLDLTSGTAGRRTFVKLRISNHKLMIEIGRYNQITRDNHRHCPFWEWSNRRWSSLSFSMSYTLFFIRIYFTRISRLKFAKF